MDPMPLEVLTCLDNVCLLWKKNRVVNWVFAEGQKRLLRSGQAHEEWHKPHWSSSISDTVRKGIVRNLAQARAGCGDSCWASCCNLVSGSSKVRNHVCSHCLHPGHALSFEACFLIVPILSWSMTVCRSLFTQVPWVFQWLPESWLWPFLGDFLAFKASMSPFCYCNQPWNKLTEMKALLFSCRFGGFSLWSVGSIACELLISWPGCKKRKEEGLRSLLYNQNTSH